MHVGANADYCFYLGTVYLPNNGNATFTADENVFNAFQQLTIEGGTNTQNIIIHANGIATDIWALWGLKVEYSAYYIYLKCIGSQNF